MFIALTRQQNARAPAGRNVLPLDGKRDGLDPQTFRPAGAGGIGGRTRAIDITPLRGWRLAARTSRPHPRSLTPSLACVALLALLFLAASTRAEDFFPTLRLENTVFTNVHVVEVTPVDVLFSADGPVFKRIKRQDLPDGLRDKYPYDPAQVEAHKREQERKAKELREQLRRENYAGLLRREKETEAQIALKTAELARVQRDINNWRARPKGYGKGPMLHQLQETKLGLLQEIDRLRQQLEQIRQALAQYR